MDDTELHLFTGLVCTWSYL